MAAATLGGNPEELETVTPTATAAETTVAAAGIRSRPAHAPHAPHAPRDGRGALPVPLPGPAPAISPAPGAAIATFILAGGEGRRLLPLTAETPKPAVGFGPDGRIIDFVLESCLASAISSVAVLAQYRAQPLERYLAERFAPRFRHAGGALAVVRQGAGPIPYGSGTADAILDGLGALRPDLRTLLVLAADHVYRMDYAAFLRAHAEARADATIAAVPVPIAEARRFGVIEAGADGAVAGFREKPPAPAPMPDDPARALASMGIYVFRREALARARAAIGRPGNVDFGRDVVPALLAGGARVVAYPHRQPGTGAPALWFDVGTPEALLEATRVLHPGGSVHSTARVAPGAAVRGSVVRAGATVEPGATVVRSLVYESAVIGAGARVEDAVVVPGARVRPGARVGPGLVVDGVEAATTAAIAPPLPLLPPGGPSAIAPGPARAAAAAASW